ncbi:hypothetical protein BGZ99_009189 [Dissophora globulifera]|uniref:Uncharacterized protein n=1 Tax=Dissophora globulifera TaxID=979702 RepID=A0A9P6UZ25_9FUNG|nr:hypothetical protein BGZ99_009189 [Dissophora globulifera]
MGYRRISKVTSRSISVLYFDGCPALEKEGTHKARERVRTKAVNDACKDIDELKFRVDGGFTCSQTTFQHKITKELLATLAINRTQLTVPGIVLHDDYNRNIFDSDIPTIVAAYLADTRVILKNKGEFNFEDLERVQDQLDEFYNANNMRFKKHMAGEVKPRTRYSEANRRHSASIKSNPAVQESQGQGLIITGQWAQKLRLQMRPLGNMIMGSYPIFIDNESPIPKFSRADKFFNTHSPTEWTPNEFTKNPDTRRLVHFIEGLRLY